MKAKRAKCWMIERLVTIKTGSNAGMVVPIRAIAPGVTKKDAEKVANDWAEKARQSLTSTGGTAETEWKRDAIVVGEIGWWDELVKEDA